MALVLTILFMLISADLKAELFPVPDEIQPNVDFWIDIYATYPSTKGVIHDTEDLSVIYEVVKLKKRRNSANRRANRAKIKKIKAKYCRILEKLASGKAAKSREEKRVAALFGPKAGSKRYKRACEKIRFQLGQRDRFLSGVQRSGQYLKRIKKIFRSYGLPEDIAYLPHVESSFNYKAYSKFGAAGMWQFTRATGRRFMQVDYVVDERRDPIVASHAAAKFMRENYQTLGNWPLAITAYNHGTSGVARAKRQKGTYLRVFSEYRGPRFRFASRNFYPEFIAARHVAKNYQRYFGNLKLQKPIPYHTVKMKGYAPISEVTAFFQVRTADLRRVNPALRPPVFEGQKYIPRDYNLRLPGKRTKMALLASAMPSAMFREGQKRSRFYRVQRGDTAGLIARRNRISLRDLIAANGLSRRATVYVGQNLRIPGGGEQPTRLAMAPAQKKRDDIPPSLAQLKKRLLTEKKSETPAPSKKIVVAALSGGSKWSEGRNPMGLTAASEEVIVLASLEAKKKKRVAVPLEAEVSHEVVPDLTKIVPLPSQDQPQEAAAEASSPSAPPAAGGEEEVVVEAASGSEPAAVEVVVKEEQPDGAEAASGSEPAAVEVAAKKEEPPPVVAAAPGPEPVVAAGEQLPAPAEVLVAEVQLEGLMSSHDPVVLPVEGPATRGEVMEQLLSMPATEPAEPAAAPEAEQESAEIGGTPAIVEEGPAHQVNPQVLSGNFSVSQVSTVDGVEEGKIQVEAEETLGHYADWLEVPTRQIRRLNKLRFGRPIRFGQRLTLAFSKVSKEAFEERRLLFHQELIEDFFQAYTITGEAPYQIKAGDNLWTLCNQQFELPFWLLRQYNSGFDFQTLRLGATIKVPIVTRQISSASESVGDPGVEGSEDDS
ncbi:MAG: transglycosylase SLT domain-containing protein [Thermodesulfobacteriota bacterium]